nr:Hsp70 family protein [Paenarthrobacter ureafaciens]
MRHAHVLFEVTMSYVLAIDVGTSFTAAAIYKEGQGTNLAPEILPLGLHGSAVPSVLYYADDGRVLVGEAAERRGLDDPQRMVREFKRRIGDSVPIAVGEAWMAPEDVYATMARWVVDKAREREGGPADSVVMTHPAAWGQHRTSTVLAALNMAGLPEVTLISEPEAAALHYASQTRVEDGSTIAVYDLGGGTFDTAVLRKAGAGRFELLGHPDGIETLGGADFDAAVLRHVVAHLGEAVTGLAPEDPATLAALSRLRRECREAKEALSLDSEASISVSLPGTQQSVRLVRAEFEAMIEPHIRDTLDALERSLAEVRLQPEDLSVVLLIGGSSRVPLVAELISVELERPIAVDADPKASICLGAALSLKGTPDAEAAALAAGSVAPAQEQREVPLETVPRPDVVRGRPALAALKAAAADGTKAGRHAPRSRVRMAAAAAAAATVLTVVTATAAQSPDVQALFGSQAADVMRDGGAQASGAQPAGAQGGAQAKGQANGGGAVPPAAKAGTGLDASAKGAAARTSAGTGQGAKKSTTGQGTGSAGTGSGAAAGATTGNAGGTTTPGTTTPGSGTGTAAPGTSTPSSPPASEPGGAASGPTPTTPPTQPPVTDPTQPPVTDPTQPPVTDPTQPPPTTTPEPDPVVPSPEPTIQAPEPPPVSQDPVPTEPATEPSVAPVPPETSPSQEPAPAPEV